MGTVKIFSHINEQKCQVDGETMATVTDFILRSSKITSDGDCRHEIKRCLFLGRKAMTNLDSILKSRDVTLMTNVCIVKAMVFPVSPFFTSGGKSIRVSASASVLQMNIQD